jgi:hypothetical protein
LASGEDPYDVPAFYAIDESARNYEGRVDSRPRIWIEWVDEPEGPIAVQDLSHFERRASFRYAELNDGSAAAGVLLEKLAFGSGMLSGRASQPHRSKDVPAPPPMLGPVID